MKHAVKLLTLIAIPALMSACASTPEPEPVVIAPEIVETCYPIATLEKVVIPAVTKSGYSIVSIENPPEYYVDPETGKTVTVQSPPIETKTPYTKVVTPEEIYYKTPEGVRTTDICELNKVTSATEPTPDT